MKLELESLKTSNLTNIEVGQLINRHLSDLDTIDPTLRTDAPFNSYTQNLAVRATDYQKGLAQAQKNEETDKVVLADAGRDKAVYAFNAALKLYSQSDIPEEVEASRSLGILFKTFKNLATLNYEAETLGIDKLVSELTSPTYSGKVSLLQMDRYVYRLQTTNENFKSLFSGRMVGNAMTETYDMKTLRKELLNKYSDFAEYILAMAKANTNSQLFAKAFNLLNTARKYYNDMVAKRTAPKAEKEKPAG
jgi:hypothetical protein